mgnify:FL=1
MNTVQQHNALVPFAFGDNMVRVHMDENGNPWWVAKDVCRVLELGNVTEATRNLDDDEKSIFRNPEVTSSGGNPNLLIISESGLYAFVFRSRKPEAKAFSKWVRSEVLPALRKTGRYETPHMARKNAVKPEKEPFKGDRLFSDAVLALETDERIRLLEQAIKVAGKEAMPVAAMEDYFVRLCEMAGKRRRDPKMEKIQRFIAECVSPMPGSRLPFMRIYSAFYDWWEANEHGAVPGSKSLALALRQYFEPQKSSNSWFRDCSLRR